VAGFFENPGLCNSADPRVACSSTAREICCIAQWNADHRPEILSQHSVFLRDRPFVLPDSGYDPGSSLPAAFTEIQVNTSHRNATAP